MKAVKNYVLEEIKLVDILRFHLLQPALNILLCPFPKIQTAKQGPLINIFFFKKKSWQGNYLLYL